MIGVEELMQGILGVALELLMVLICCGSTLLSLQVECLLGLLECELLKVL